MNENPYGNHWIAALEASIETLPDTLCELITAAADELRNGLTGNTMRYEAASTRTNDPEGGPAAVSLAGAILDRAGFPPELNVEGGIAIDSKNRAQHIRMPNKLVRILDTLEAVGKGRYLAAWMLLNYNGGNQPTDHEAAQQVLGILEIAAVQRRENYEDAHPDDCVLLRRGHDQGWSCNAPATEAGNRWGQALLAWLAIEIPVLERMEARITAEREEQAAGTSAQPPRKPSRR